MLTSPNSEVNKGPLSNDGPDNAGKSDLLNQLFKPPKEGEQKKEAENKPEENKEASKAKEADKDKSSNKSDKDNKDQSRSESAESKVADRLANDRLRIEATEASRAWTRAQVVEATVTLLSTYLQRLEFQQPKPTGQDLTGVIEQARAELSNAPEPIKGAYVDQVVGKTISLEQLAQVNAWRAFNGNDYLSNPKDGQPADARLSLLGRQLVEMRELANFNKPLSVTSQIGWTSEIKNIANPNSPLRPEQVQIFNQIVDQKVKTIQSIFSHPELANQIRGLKNDTDLSNFLSQTENKLFPNRIVIPADVIAKGQIANQTEVQRNQFEQAARARFPGDDALSTINRQVMQARAFVAIGKLNEAIASFDSSKNNTSVVSDWLKSGSTQPNAAVLNDRLAAIEQITRETSKYSFSTEVINSNFLALMEANVKSTHGGQKLSVIDEACRRAVLEHIKNPSSIDILLAGKVDQERQTAVQEALATRAEGIAINLHTTDRRYMWPAGQAKPSVDFDLISTKIKEITFPQTRPETPPPNPSAVRLENSNSNLLVNTGSDQIIREPDINNNANSANLINAVNASAPRSVREAGAPALLPLETPRFSVNVLNNLVNEIRLAREAFAVLTSTALRSDLTPSRLSPEGNNQPENNILTLSIDSSRNYFSQSASYFNLTPTLAVNPDNMSQAAATVYSDLASYPTLAHNNNLPNNYSNGNFVTDPFAVKPTETRLTGRGTNLDGANRGVMAAGGSTMSRNSSAGSSRWSPFAANGSASNTASAILNANSSNATGSSVMAGPSAPRGPAGSGGFSFAFSPAWHFGLLNACRSGDIALGINNRSIIKDEEEQDKEEKEQLKQMWA